MPWSILWTDQALRDMTRIDPPIAKRIVRKLEQAAGDPMRYFSRLVAADEHKLRIGDFRPFAALDRESQTVLVERVGHRSRIYGRG
jgi:mRNA interferase RelE/StbE